MHDTPAILPSTRKNKSANMKAALVIINPQVFFSDLLDRPLPQIKTLIDYFNDSAQPIILLQSGFTKDDIAPPITNQIVSNFGAPSDIKVDSPGWQLHPQILEIVPNAPVVRKSTNDAFLDTGLETLLRRSSVQRVVIAGVRSELCCNTTARTAFCRDFETWFIEDACWTDTREKHERTVEDMRLVLNRVYTVDEAVELFRGEKAEGG